MITIRDALKKSFVELLAKTVPCLRDRLDVLWRALFVHRFDVHHHCGTNITLSGDVIALLCFLEALFAVDAVVGVALAHDLTHLRLVRRPWHKLSLHLANTGSRLRRALDLHGMEVFSDQFAQLDMPNESRFRELEAVLHHVIRQSTLVFADEPSRHVLNGVLQLEHLRRRERIVIFFQMTLNVQRMRHSTRSDHRGMIFAMVLNDHLLKVLRQCVDLPKRVGASVLLAVESHVLPLPDRNRQKLHLSVVFLDKTVELCIEV